MSTGRCSALIIFGGLLLLLLTPYVSLVSGVYSSTKFPFLLKFFQDPKQEEELPLICISGKVKFKRKLGHQ